MIISIKDKRKKDFKKCVLNKALTHLLKQYRT